MADNFVTNAGSGGSTFAADDVSSVLYPRVKPVWSADGVAPNDVSANKPLPVNPHLTENNWSYAAATGGISNTTTAVTVKAAAGASVRNYVASMQLSSDALGAATELCIRDGAGGTVLWRGKLSTAAFAPSFMEFDPPLQGTANTLLEIVTLTATITGGVFANLQGFTGP